MPDSNLITRARVELGRKWSNGGEPLTPRQLARALNLSPKNGDDHVRNMESGKSAVSGPIERLIEIYLSGEPVPPDNAEVFRDGDRPARRIAAA